MGKLPFIQRAVALEREILDRVVRAQQNLSELEGQKAELVSQVAVTADSLTDMVKRKADLSDSVDAAILAAEQIAKVSAQAMHSSLEEIRRGRGVFDDLQVALKEMGEKLLKASDGVKEAQSVKARVMEEVTKEHSAMAKRRAELDAFEAFIKEVYDEELFPLSAFNL